MRVLSPAKCNLFFRVLKKRSDGYHEIASLMQKLDISDEIELSLSETDTFSCTNPHIPLDHRNSLIKARDLFRQSLGLKFHLSIHLTKNIPIEAGLGGGSSNAATLLSALNTLLKTHLSQKDLIELGAQIGSDVPFFFTSGVAYATGRGEILEEIPISPFAIKVSKPPFGMSTPEVYRHLTIAPGPDPLLLLESFKRRHPLLINDLERSAFALKPELADYKATLSPQSVMTGSGSAFISLI